MRRSVPALLSMILLLACEADTPEAPPEAPAPPAVPAPPEAPPPEAPPPEGVVEFTPEATCLGGIPTRLYPPCEGALSEAELRIEGARGVGLIRAGEAVDPAALCRYGTVAAVGDQYVMWWPPDRFTDQGQAMREVGGMLSMACEDAGWIAGGFVTLEDGLPVRIELTDPRFRTRGGAGVGMTVEAFKAALPGGKLVPGPFDGDESYQKAPITAPLQAGEDTVQQLSVAL
jgi:hypothetical protein